MTQDNREITLKLKVNDVNTVLASLQEMPHRVSDPVIRAIIEQVQPQIQQSEAEEVQLPSESDSE
jgi:hypothetical protein